VKYSQHSAFWQAMS